MSKERILIVDDEPMVREVVARYLERDGFRVDSAADGKAALELARDHPPDVLILDVMLPARDGFSVLQELRKTSTLPVILLTARGEETDRVLGLELGADDYVVKPFSPRELSARVRSVLRRVKPSLTSARLEFEDLVIDPSTREVHLGGKEVDLTPKEFDLLAYLAAHPRRVFSRGQLLHQVWDSSADWQDPATVTVHMRRLRDKLEEDPSEPRRLVTVWGVGYRFVP